MFSGVIAQQGRVAALEQDARGGIRLRVESPAIAAEAKPKDSISVDGVCLTVVETGGGSMSFDVVPETLDRSTLGSLRPGDVVNLELSLRLGDRLGGHLVYGHVDDTALIEAKVPEGQGYRLRVRTPPALAMFIVEKGNVALDGVSLTVAVTGLESFEVALIPETIARTSFGRKSAGDAVNLEIDQIARYTAAAVASYRSDGPTSDELAWAYDI